ncbi:MAG: acetate--CoA ligase family protein [Candidatus Marsarchaeota archaeon]|nr:acetate--CoA ligase family protein [Candidatus Marsarchaeota archaeon]MCL5105773.1 acetate--CoA ligase family protein [Candidatus Marsarchaeota archaeon]
MVLVDYDDGKKILDKYRIQSVPSKYVQSADEAVAFSSSLKGKEMAMKVISKNPDALHKAKKGLVALNLKEKEDIVKAWKDLESKAKQFMPYKIQAQEMVRGIEIIIGGKIDPQFGKIVIIGLGGIYVEVLKDFQIGICPVEAKNADIMIGMLKSKQILLNSIKKETLVRLIMDVSRMMLENDISELDLNPMIIHDGKIDAVDIRIIK